VINVATGQVEDREPDSDKDPAAQTLGRNGGKARADNLSAEQRQEIARKASQTRWHKKP
jgi:hypothetical protein